MGLCRSLSMKLEFYLSFTLKHSYTHTLTHSHTHTYSHALSHTLTHTLLSFSFTISLSLTRSFSLKVSRHNKEDDCWVAIRGRVYDVTHFLHAHPGGKRILMKVAGVYVCVNVCVCVCQLIAFSLSLRDGGDRVFWGVSFEICFGKRYLKEVMHRLSPFPLPPSLWYSLSLSLFFHSLLDYLSPFLIFLFDST